MPTSTSTITATTTTTVTAPTSTDTATSTSTETDSTTSTSTATTTTTSTFSSVATTTSAAPAGFIAIQTSLPGSEYSGSGGADPIAKRDVDVHMEVGRDTTRPKPSGLLEKSWQSYPMGVTCYAWTHTTCKASTTTLTVTSTVQPSTTVTSTSTSSTTTYPSATTTTTTTSTTTTTLSATTTETSTSTITVVASTTTLYAACATSNLADNYLGQPIGNIQGNFNNILVSNTNTAYDCCVAALANPNDAIFLYIPNYSSQDESCLLYTVNTCPAGQASDQLTAVTGSYGYGQITAGNSNCGTFVAAAA
ncbi:uncharacterized protein Z520_11201 [Fonsecaea multimorphosa CBS 102226]|uniref:Apple domain-containing protein n=1 Tax=Fonsecaea multimorphosa CBS 102226 TaxID=1442371 RepID=A0A0D2JRR9_9EURO|nr:uncharacterized protein Z520_11201 [Fonsecaea multimorphosa CBS 102226]KIX93144.1 hypothetical protein Z520_11201 [Fonsecaea multimorphosa CBS 102226]